MRETRDYNPTELPESDNGHQRAAMSYAPGPDLRLLRTLYLPAALALACALGAFIVTTAMPKQYRATTTIFFPASGGTSASSLIGMLNGGNGIGETAGNVALLGGLMTSPQLASGPATAIAVMSSERLRTRVAKDCNLEQQWHQPMRDVLKHLDGVVTYSINKNGLLEIEAADTDPNLAAQLAASYTTELKDVATDLSVDVSRRNRIFVEDRLRSSRMDLTQKETRLVALQRRTAVNLTSSAAANKVADSLANLEVELNETQIEEQSNAARIQWETQAVEKTTSNSLNLPAQSAFAQQSRDRLRKLESQFAIAQETLGPDNPDYQMLKIQLEAARSQVRAEANREINALRKGIAPEVSALYGMQAGIQAKREGLEEALTQIKKRVVTVPGAQMREQQLTDDIKIESGIVTMLEGEAEKARIAEDRDANTFEVVDPPTRPEEPFAPRRGFTTLFAAIAGLLAGIAWQTARSIARQSRDPDTAPAASAV